MFAGECRLHRVQSMIGVVDWRAEDGQDRIANVFVDEAAVTVQQVRDFRVIAI